MKVNGYVLLSNKAKSAIADLDPKKAFSALSLSRKLESEGVPNNDGLRYISMPAAQRLIQLLRKQGAIKKYYGGGGNTLWIATNKKKKIQIDL